MDAIRVSAPAGPFRRAGFGFGKEAVAIAASAINWHQLALLAREPKLVVEAIAGPGIYVRINDELLKMEQLLGDAAKHSVEEIARRVAEGDFHVGSDVLDAMCVGIVDAIRDRETAPAAADTLVPVTGSGPPLNPAAYQRLGDGEAFASDGFMSSGVPDPLVGAHVGAVTVVPPVVATTLASATTDATGLAAPAPPLTPSAADIEAATADAVQPPPGARRRQKPATSTTT